MSAPMFHVKRGDPSPEELAALTAVLAIKAGSAAAARTRHRQTGPPPWGAPTAAHRLPLPPPGPGAWKRGLWTATDPRPAVRPRSPTGVLGDGDA
ncbi:MAG TPA: acyl-CoA carboxylase epsilon subunit [Actinomycetota bacterium]|nr:acyl-CoA carboxylase epsilon subunit [Actinomycetota bacterium]